MLTTNDPKNKDRRELTILSEDEARDCWNWFHSGTGDRLFKERHLYVPFPTKDNSDTSLGFNKDKDVKSLHERSIVQSPREGEPITFALRLKRENDLHMEKLRKLNAPIGFTHNELDLYPPKVLNKFMSFKEF